MLSVVVAFQVIESMDELMMEIESGTEEISNQSLEHIHTNEVILTLGRSRTVEKFLKHAAKERKFQVRTKILINLVGCTYLFSSQISANSNAIMTHDFFLFLI